MIRHCRKFIRYFEFILFHLQYLILVFSINTFLLPSKYSIYFTGIQMLIPLSNYRLISIIRSPYKIFIYLFFVTFKTIQMSLLIKLHRHPKNGSYIRATLISNQILFSTLQSVSDKLAIITEKLL